MLSLLNASQYIQGFKPAFQSDIGTHFRHVLEHYRCFFGQMASAEFRYDCRLRDARLESELDYAKETMLETIRLFGRFDMSLFARDYTLGEEQSDGDLEGVLINGVKTTLERELMFLQSHTVHHYAMVAAMMRALGLEPDAEFGVAIPTRNYTRRLDQDNDDKVLAKTKRAKSLCAQ